MILKELQYLKDPKELFKGSFGLEKECLRADRQGRLAKTSHPFQNDNITKDFSESQPEINTDVFPSLIEARQQLLDLTTQMNLQVAQHKEILWPFSMPCQLPAQEDILVAQGTKESMAYRNKLAVKYGKKKMMVSGIHFNFSFDPHLLENLYRLDQSNHTFVQFKNQFYVQLAAKALKYGWMIEVICNGSSLLDQSYYEEDKSGTLVTTYSSIRNSKEGYWNHFTPILSYDSLFGYVQSIQKYVDQKDLIQESELYYPIRLKPLGGYKLSHLLSFGVEYIELRMIDLNPYDIAGVNIQDLHWIHLFLIWLAFLPKETMGESQQKEALENFKQAACLDIEKLSLIEQGQKKEIILSAALSLLEKMETFFSYVPEEYQGVFSFQKNKLKHYRKKGYGYRIQKDFGSNYIEQGTQYAKEIQKEMLTSILEGERNI